MRNSKKQSNEETVESVPILLYQRKLLELEQEYEEVREQIKSLQDELKDAVEDVSRAIKLRLDLVLARARLLKDQTAYYLKLREMYDYACLFRDFQEELSKEAPDLAKKIIRRIDRRWQRRWQVTYKKLSGASESRGEAETAEEKTDRSPS